jgi:putative spermidine/putrescine transport system ATP-binding protein
MAVPDGAPAGGPIVMALRPEKITCTAPGSGRCEGQITERFFLGNLWMYSVRSPMGELLVSAVNDGAPPREIGQAVGLDWQDRNVRVIGMQPGVQA